MKFADFVLDLLKTYPSQNPGYKDEILGQIAALQSVSEEINGYGAYSDLVISPTAKRLPPEASHGYLNNDLLVLMEGRQYALQFILSVNSEGYIDQLEIFPSDGIGWNGVIREYRIAESE